jgi:hypothetical protein
VALLLPGVGSVTPAGAVTVAVFTSCPDVPDGTVPVMTNVALAPAGRSTVAFTLPVPEAVLHPPPDELHVHVNAASGPGNASCTVAPRTLLGPLLSTVTA